MYCLQVSMGKPCVASNRHVSPHPAYTCNQNACILCLAASQGPALPSQSALCAASWCHHRRFSSCASILQCPQSCLPALLTFEHACLPARPPRCFSVFKSAIPFCPFMWDAKKLESGMSAIPSCSFTQHGSMCAQADPAVWVNTAVGGIGNGGSKQLTLVEATSGQTVYLVDGCLAGGKDKTVVWNVNGITSGSIDIHGAGDPKQLVVVDSSTGHKYLLINGCLAGDAPAGNTLLFLQMLNDPFAHAEAASEMTFSPSCQPLSALSLLWQRLFGGPWFSGITSSCPYSRAR